MTFTSFISLPALLLSTSLLLSHVAHAEEAIFPKPAQSFDIPRYVPGQATPGYTPYTYTEAQQHKLNLFIFQPVHASSTPKPAILLFHSGGWVRGRPEWLFGLAKQFAEDGLVAIPVQYRLSDANTTPADALNDACEAFRWVRAHASTLNIDASRIAGWGASAGGQLVAATATAGCPSNIAEENAADAAANALILVSASVDTEQSAHYSRLLGPGADARRFSPIAHIRQGTPPTLHIAGAEDTVAPVSTAQLYCEKVVAAHGRCQAIVYPGVGHLLTRNLLDQRSTLDPDPELELAAYGEQKKFLRDLGYLEP